LVQTKLCAYCKEEEYQYNLKRTRKKEQENLNKQLSQKADSSEKTVKDIALKALDSTSKMQIISKETKPGEYLPPVAISSSAARRIAFISSFVK